MGFSKSALPKCPQCGELRLETIESRPSGSATRRRKQCDACGFRITTYEVSSEYFKELTRNQEIVSKISKLLGSVPGQKILSKEPRCIDCFYNTNASCSFDLPEYNTEDSYDCNHYKQ